MAFPAVARARQLYGAHPLHLALILGSFAVAGYALSLLGFSALWNPDTWWQSIALWFVGAALVHDLVLFPAYAAADRILVAVTTRRTTTGPTRALPPLVNFVRVPLLAVGLITLVFFPGIIKQGADTYNRATGQTQEPFLHRWLLLCALILVSGLVCYLVARAASGRRRAGSDKGPSRFTTEDDPAVARQTANVDKPPASVSAVVIVAILVALAARQRRSTRRAHHRAHR